MQCKSLLAWQIIEIISDTFTATSKATIFVTGIEMCKYRAEMWSSLDQPHSSTIEDNRLSRKSNKESALGPLDRRCDRQINLLLRTVPQTSIPWYATPETNSIMDQFFVRGASFHGSAQVQENNNNNNNASISGNNVRYWSTDSNRISKNLYPT